MASSDFLDSRKGCLWKSSLPCIKNRRFRVLCISAGRFGTNDVKKARQS